MSNDLKEIMPQIHRTATEKGFHDNDHLYEELPDGRTRLILSHIALMQSELGEAVEGVRLGDMENVAEEFADTIIRILDTCVCFDIDVVEAINKKMAKNAERSRMHGGKRA